MPAQQERNCRVDTSHSCDCFARYNLHATEASLIAAGTAWLQEALCLFGWPYQSQCIIWALMGIQGTGKRIVYAFQCAKGSRSSRPEGLVEDLATLWIA